MSETSHVVDPRPFEPSLTLDDDVLRGEIELVADLVIAASGSDGPLSQAQIDEVLGLGGPTG